MPNYMMLLRHNLCGVRRREISAKITQMVMCLNAGLAKLPRDKTTLKKKRRDLLEDTLERMTKSVREKYPLADTEINQVRMAIYDTRIMDGAYFPWSHRTRLVKKYSKIWRNGRALHWRAAGSRRERLGGHARFS